MALRVEDLSGPRNITTLQSLNRLNWKDFNNLPNFNSRLTVEEATILKEQRGETYNGPYMPSEEYLPSPVEHKFRKLKIIEGGSETISLPNNKSFEVLTNLSKLPEQIQDIFVPSHREPIDTGDYNSDGEPL